MLVLVSGATRYPRGHGIGHLIVPKQWNDPATLGLPHLPRQWAMDNGAFAGFDAGAFTRMLEAYHGYQRYAPLFVTAPDVVGDAASTLRLWPFWSRLIRGLGWPVALVAQDGLTCERVPWDELDALFVGGTTAWKEGAAAATLCGMAKARGKWVHVGRVNGQRRFRRMQAMGCDSIDGTGFSMYPDVNIPKVQAWREPEPQLSLLGGVR